MTGKTTTHAKPILVLAAVMALAALLPARAEAQSKFASQALVLQQPALARINPAIINLGNANANAVNLPAGASAAAGGNQPGSADGVPGITGGRRDSFVPTRPEFPRDTPRTSDTPPMRPTTGPRSFVQLQSVQSIGQLVAAPVQREVEAPRQAVVNMLENRPVVPAASGGALASADMGSRARAMLALDSAKPLI